MTIGHDANYIGLAHSYSLQPQMQRTNLGQTLDIAMVSWASAHKGQQFSEPEIGWEAAGEACSPGGLGCIRFSTLTRPGIGLGCWC